MLLRTTFAVLAAIMASLATFVLATSASAASLFDEGEAQKAIAAIRAKAGQSQWVLNVSITDSQLKLHVVTPKCKGPFRRSEDSYLMSYLQCAIFIMIEWVY